MSKIIKKSQKIFAGGVPASGVIAQYGSLVAKAPIYSNNPDIIQALPAWEEGLKSALIDGYNPTIQDLNALLYVITRQIAYRMQSGIPEWNAETTYYIGSFVTDGAGTIYKSVTDDNLNQALTIASQWLNYKSIKQTEIGASYTVLNSDYIVNWSLNAVPGHDDPPEDQVTLPAPIAALAGRMVIVKVTSSTSENHVRIKTANASTINTLSQIECEQYHSRTFICDGAKWSCFGDFSIATVGE